MAKAAAHCIGKYKSGIGVEDAFIESGTFGSCAISPGRHTLCVFCAWHVADFRSNTANEMGDVLGK